MTRPKSKRPQPRVTQMKIEISADTERKFKAHCVLAGKTRQKLLGEMIEFWVAKQEKK